MIVKTIQQVKEQVENWRKDGLTVGLVPTMGYLHEGHKSLILRAAKECDKVVVSIFVNPIQFGPNEDLDKYPRDIYMDKEICKNAGADLIFAPEDIEMYPYGKPYTYIDVEKLSKGLCGAKRPGHFVGVCTVVAKLFNIVNANKAYFGQKDAQQLAIIKKMVEDLNFDVEIVSCPIIREKDGLALSSRNTYLSVEERKAALVLSRSLNKAKKALEAGEILASNIKNLIIEEINKEPLAKIDYVEIVDADNLQDMDKIDKEALIGLAVFIGKTRLIDNLVY